MREKFNLLLLAAVASTITYFSVVSIEASGAPGGTFSFLHLSAYFGLAAAFLLKFHDTDRGHLEAFLAAGMFGLAIEIIQYGIPYRAFTLQDVGINFLGASVVLLDQRVKLVTEIVAMEDRVLEAVIEQRF